MTRASWASARAIAEAHAIDEHAVHGVEPADQVELLEDQREGTAIGVAARHRIEDFSEGKSNVPMTLAAIIGAGWKSKR